MSIRAMVFIYKNGEYYEYKGGPRKSECRYCGERLCELVDEKPVWKDYFETSLGLVCTKCFQKKAT